MGRAKIGASNVPIVIIRVDVERSKWLADSGTLANHSQFRDFNSAEGGDVDSCRDDREFWERENGIRSVVYDRDGSSSAAMEFCNKSEGGE